ACGGWSIQLLRFGLPSPLSLSFLRTFAVLVRGFHDYFVGERERRYCRAASYSRTVPIDRTLPSVRVVQPRGDILNRPIDLLIANEIGGLLASEDAIDTAGCAPVNLDATLDAKSVGNADRPRAA